MTNDTNVIQASVITTPKATLRRQYIPTAQVDNIIRNFQGHVETVMDVIDWPYDAVLKRVLELEIRKKNQKVPKIGRFLGLAAIDEVIRKYNGYAVPIRRETGWSRKAIRERAIFIGVIKPGEHRHANQKIYIPTAQIDEIIRENFSNKHARGVNTRTVSAINALGGIRWSESAVSRRALELGLSHPAHDAEWTMQEDEVVLQSLRNCRTIRSIQRKLNTLFPNRRHTESAIVTRMSYLQARKDADSYNQGELASLLGVSTVLVARWTGLRHLNGKRALTGNADSIWYYKKPDVRKFVLAHPDYVDLSRVNKTWFIDLLSGPKRITPHSPFL
jgi:hypothetical protein